MSNLDSEGIVNISITFLVAIIIVCIMGATVKSCQICEKATIEKERIKENADIEKERIRFNSGYDQVMVVGYNRPIWKKIVKDTVQ